MVSDELKKHCSCGIGRERNRCVCKSQASNTDLAKTKALAIGYFHVSNGQFDFWQVTSDETALSCPERLVWSPTTTMAALVYGTFVIIIEVKDKIKVIANLSMEDSNVEDLTWSADLRYVPQSAYIYLNWLYPSFAYFKSSIGTRRQDKSSTEEQRRMCLLVLRLS